MKPETEGWVSKADGNWNVANREMQPTEAEREANKRWVEYAGLIVLGSVLVAYIAFLVFGPPIASLMWSISPKPLPINITRVQYDKALTKWRMQSIEQYEITTEMVALGGGTRTLQVSDHGNKIVIIDPLPIGTPDPEYLRYYKTDTIEGMFDEVEGLLKDQQVIHSGATMSTGDFTMSFEVEFEPTLGYPISMEGQPVTAPGVVVFDAAWKRTVTNLTILKSGTSTKLPAVP